ncbi:MAG: hypothetical protein PHY14_03420 [Candidatus Gracilibacteria bacterium]|nr:hypothetical protein [Candidatus Gracilibacteria bacterium]
MRFFRLFFVFLLTQIILPAGVFAVGLTAEIGISPPRNEFSMDPGQTVTREIIVFNNSNTETYTLNLSGGDCIADVHQGAPICHTYKGNGMDRKSLSSWMSFGEYQHFTLKPRQQKKIQITFSAPTNALPGGHYGIVYFTPEVPSTNGGSAVTMIYQLSTLFQVTVSGDIIYDVEFEGVNVETSFSSAPEVHPISEFIKAPTDTKTWSGALNFLKDSLDPLWSAPTLEKENTDFNVKFSIPVTNSGNIDVRPIGQIELYDENGNLLKKVGKESIKTAEGLYVGERVVDYLPINDEGGSVLPDGDRRRIYSVDWKGFAYEGYEDGKVIVKYQDPGDYYSELTMKDAAMIFPWEKLEIRTGKKLIKARVSLEYIGKDNKVVPVEFEKDIMIQYKYIAKTLNIGGILLALFIIVLIWILFRKKSRIEELEEENEDLEEEVDELEDEINELEKAKINAQKILEQKKRTTIKKASLTPVKTKSSTKKETPTKNSDSKKETPKPQTTKKVSPPKKPTEKKPITRKATTPRKPSTKKEAPTNPEA